MKNGDKLENNDTIKLKVRTAIKIKEKFSDYKCIKISYQNNILEGKDLQGSNDMSTSRSFWNTLTPPSITFFASNPAKIAAVAALVTFA